MDNKRDTTSINAQDNWFVGLTQQLATMRTALFQFTLLFLAVTGEYFRHIPILPFPEPFEQEHHKQYLFLSSAGIFRPPPDPKGKPWLEKEQGHQEDRNSTRAALEGWGRYTLWGGIELDHDRSVEDSGVGYDRDTVENGVASYNLEQQSIFHGPLLLSSLTWAHSFPFDSPTEGWQNGASQIAPLVTPSGTEISHQHLESKDELSESDYDWDVELPLLQEVPPNIPPRVVFGTDCDKEHSTIQIESCDEEQSLCNSFTLLDTTNTQANLHFCYSQDSSWSEDFVPFESTPTLFLYHISSGVSFHGRYHSNSTLSSRATSEIQDVDLHDILFDSEG